ncbi:hypothetical protein [Mucilaginibacter pedocola]|uniref:Uncharacterized protein n=1 Tax=Mucilaginibacter pedocola TaxID=1792845 RepID=A0A1S9PDQ1_9SPHI|nr:hypothetical protein [Mucilaginibacter pedocola]OOQ59083.1 hypothetical protein BC343_29650 [Mucilaginibacter pedocola]
MRRYLTIVLCFAVRFCQAQESSSQYFNFYPIGDEPNLGYKTSMVKSEKILFEANPTMRFSFYNNIYRKLIRDEKKGMQAWYVSFRPQLRMYTDNSLPVRTPSYRILLGTQRLFRISKNNLLAISLESGHYSNGQDGGAFTTQYPDGSQESEAIYNTITPTTNLSEILNRRSGNFSTDLTELIVNYRINTKLDDNCAPKETHVLKAGAVLYHNYLFGIADIGGYTPNDIKIYGRWRTQVGYQYIRVIKNGNMRYSLAGNLEAIHGAHPSVEDLRLELTASLYPFKGTPQLGFFGSFIGGHDNYNYRFVDSGTQGFFGITWAIFPPVTIHTLCP